MNNLSLAIIGFGNSARAFTKILMSKEHEIRQLFDYNIQINSIATATRGNVYCKEGINPLDLLNNNEYFNHKDYTAMSVLELIDIAQYDVLIELTPLNIETGQPAIEYIKRALKRGKSVITANKGPLANAHNELKSLAISNSASFLYETTVMDGAPIFNLIEDTLPFCEILGFEGILNTTTNFILDKMEHGMSYDSALELGRSQGFVEADPQNDLAGKDAAAKTAVLANVLMNASIKPNQVDYEGIMGITSDDILSAASANKRYKLVCKATKEEEIKTSVKLQLLDLSHPLANINGTSSALNIHTDLMGIITIIENNPSIEQTGYGIFSDLIKLLKKGTK
jgi:homoserine dehydrogenase